jgi:probable HAF family extracellular repeat protein
MRDLGPGTAFQVIVRGINDQGDVLATVYHDYARVSPVIWRGGVPQDLGGLSPLLESYAYGWDGGSRVVGQAAAFIADGTTYYHPFLWDGAMQDLGVLGPAGDSLSCAQRYCSQGIASDINRLGHAVGWSTDSSDQIRGFLWDGTALRDLGVMPGQATWAVAINDHDEIAGEYAPDVYAAELHAFQWSGGVLRELGSLGGDRTGVAAMNEDGAIVGYSETADGATHAYVWRDGEMVDLGVGPSGGEFSSAVGVNERGDVIGVGGTYLGRRYAILWRRETTRHKPPVAVTAAAPFPTHQTLPESSAR